MQLIAKFWHFNLADLTAIGARVRVNIHNQQRVVELAARRVKRRYKCILLWRRLHRQPWRRVKRRVWFQKRHKTFSCAVTNSDKSSRKETQDRFISGFLKGWHF